MSFTRKRVSDRLVWNMKQDRTTFEQRIARKPTKKINIELTAREADILRANWSANLSYGAGGTFSNLDGDGTNGEFSVGKTILRKIDSAIALSKI